MVAAAYEVVAPRLPGYFHVAGIDGGYVLFQRVALAEHGKDDGPEEGEQACVHGCTDVVCLFRSICMADDAAKKPKVPVMCVMEPKPASQPIFP